MVSVDRYTVCIVLDNPSTFIFNFNVVFICKILHMHASQALLLRRPPHRRNVIRIGIFEASWGARCGV
jgi:hypothetical protein